MPVYHLDGKNYRRNDQISEREVSAIMLMTDD